jgi:hypothetical protein
MGDDDPQSVGLQVRAEDLVPGVYEAVVTASPTTGVSYTLQAELPPLDITWVDDGPVATVRNRSDRGIEAAAAAELIGSTTSRHIEMVGSRAYVIQVEQPSWSNELVLDVALREDYWNRLTDFGVTVFDTLGSKLTDSPQNYAFGRQVITLDSLQYDGDLIIELLPAYAHLRPEEVWEGDLRINFMSAERIALPAADSVASARQMAPGEVALFQFSAVPTEFALPVGFDPLVEVKAGSSVGSSAVRRSGIRPTSATVPEP